MIFTLENILDSLAGVLKAKYSYPVYTSPNQQGTEYPCFFIFYMPSKIGEQVDNRQLLDLGIDVIFVQQRNIVDRNKKILEVAGYLDETLGLFEYSDDSGEKTWIRTYERQWQNEDDELHYQFYIRQRVSARVDVDTMWRLEENNAGIKND